MGRSLPESRRHADAGAACPRHTTCREPRSYRRLSRSIFLRFLKFGALAWGGPAAQIAMIKHECVDEEGWVSEETFKKTLAVYQVLPAPEAHELCVYFGRAARWQARRVPRPQPLARQADRALRGSRLRGDRRRSAAHGPVAALRDAPDQAACSWGTMISAASSGVISG